MQPSSSRFTPDLDFDLDFEVFVASVTFGKSMGLLIPGLRLARPLPDVRTKMAPCFLSTSLPGRVKEEGPTPAANSGENKPPLVVTGPVEKDGENSYNNNKFSNI